MYPQKVISKKNPDPFVRGMDPIQIRIRIHIKKSWIRNTAGPCVCECQFNSTNFYWIFYTSNIWVQQAASLFAWAQLDFFASSNSVSAVSLTTVGF
jgi:hypothetical protein